VLGGFNTNVRYRDRTFHVQTEDGGADSPNVITLLYEGGAILFSRKSSYADLAAHDREAAVRQMMEEQHRSVVQALKTGKLDDKLGVSGAATVEFGAGLIGPGRLDELVLEILAS
jgi:hypothetical protein